MQRMKNPFDSVFRHFAPLEGVATRIFARAHFVSMDRQSVAADVNKNYRDTQLFSRPNSVKVSPKWGQIGPENAPPS
jgi:hypothetical protein